MGDGSGVLFDSFLHLQGRKKDTRPRRKSNIRDREEIEKLLSLPSHSLSSLLFCCFSYSLQKAK